MIGTRYNCLGGEFFSIRPVESYRDQISLLERRNILSMATSEKIYAFPFSSLCRRVRQGLDIVAREKISCVQCQQSQIGTRSLCQGRDLYFQGPLRSDREYIFSIGRSLLSRASRVRQGLYLFSMKDFFLSMASLLRMRYILYRNGIIRQGLDYFAKDEISSLQEQDNQIGT